MTFKIIDGDISDGYHTFGELYDHRCLLYLNLCLNDRRNAYWRPDFEGWFILYLETYEGQISYHLPNKLLPYVEERITRDDDAKWDGHTGAVVLKRLERLLLPSEPTEPDDVIPESERDLHDDYAETFREDK